MLADADGPKKMRRLPSSRNRGAGRWSPDGEYLLYVESIISVWNDPDQCPAGIMVYRLRDGANGFAHRSCQVTGSGTYRWLLNKDIAAAASADRGSLRLR
jgi:Tol biopolymer transport system component